MTVGAHRVQYGTPSDVAVSSDASCDVVDATIRHGRDDPTGQPEAATATLSLPGVAPFGLDIGSPIVVETQAPDASWSRRFTGTVTDIAASWVLGRNPVTGEPDVVPETTLTAAGPLSDLGRHVVGDLPWPQELDGARVGRILALAAADGGLAIGVVDPGTVAILPRDVDRQPALTLAQAVATDGGGIVWETRAGLVSYADADHRKSAGVAATLDACQVLVTPVYSRTVAGLVNDVALAYGVAPDGSDQPVYHVVRDDSLARFGRYAYSGSTQLATLADATARASVLVTRGGLPVWNVSALPLDLSILDAATTTALLALDMHSMIGVVDLPYGAPEERTSLWVEGWEERLAYGAHDLTLTVSAYCRTAPPLQWDEAPSSWAWDTVAGVVTRQNLATNPIAGLDAHGWEPWTAGSEATAARVTGRSGYALGVSTAVRMTWTAPGEIGYGLYLDPVLGVVAGQQHSALVQVRVNRAQTIGLSFSWASAPDGSGDIGYHEHVVHLEPNEVTTLHVEHLAPAGAQSVWLGIYSSELLGGTPWRAGDWLEATLAQIETTPNALTADTDITTGVFHGSMPDSHDSEYEWAGVAHASVSKRYSPARPAWNDATCFGGPPPSSGRWSDVPATETWDSAPNELWDEWSG